MKPIFWKLFKRKGSLGSCATFNDNMVSISFSVLSISPHKFENYVPVTKSAKNTEHYGQYLAKLEAKIPYCGFLTFVLFKRQLRKSRDIHFGIANSCLLFGLLSGMFEKYKGSVLTWCHSNMNTNIPNFQLNCNNSAVNSFQKFLQ